MSSPDCLSTDKHTESPFGHQTCGARDRTFRVDRRRGGDCHFGRPQCLPEVPCFVFVSINMLRYKPWPLVNTAGSRALQDRANHCIPWVYHLEIYCVVRPFTFAFSTHLFDVRDGASGPDSSAPNSENLRRNSRDEVLFLWLLRLGNTKHGKVYRTSGSMSKEITTQKLQTCVSVALFCTDRGLRAWKRALRSTGPK